MLISAPRPTGTDPISGSTKIDGRASRSVPWFALLSGAAVLVAVCALALGGLGYSTPGAQVSVAGLDHELSRVLHEQLLSQGFDYEPSVACNPTDDSHFTCVVTIETPEGKTIAETVAVTCGAPSPTTGHRCSTDGGYALQ
jgi:hypothetical protein